jgi:thiamine pyrophosphate-dependent acetolactate synthase large subunit-like protein
MKNRFDGGNAIVEAFHKLGVEYILSSPGTEWAPVWEAMADQIHRRKEGPKLLDVWHETLAVDMAAGYTLATGRMQAPDFVKVAESVGGYGEQVTDPEKVQDTLKRGLEANRSGKPAIIDVIVA